MRPRQDRIKPIASLVSSFPVDLSTLTYQGYNKEMLTKIKALIQYDVLDSTSNSIIESWFILGAGGNPSKKCFFPCCRRKLTLE